MSDTLKRIDEIVKGNPVVLFMKGTSQFPMCGFSGRAIQILKACGVTNVKTFNVLEDEDIRERKGREMEIINMAAEKIKKSLSEYHQYQDGTLDRPFLTPESVEDNDD